MEISSFNTTSTHGAPHAASLNFVAAHALPPSFIAPGKTFSECTNLIFSESFTKYLNVTRNTPPLTIVDNVNEYFSACVCKAYNDTFPSLKDKASIVFKNTDPPKAPSTYSRINSLAKIPPIFQNISLYFFKNFLPSVVNQTHSPSTVGRGVHFSITYIQKLSDTIINLDLGHYYAKGSTPARNQLDASIGCTSERFTDWVNADSRIIDFVKTLCINHFQKMGVEVYINDDKI